MPEKPPPRLRARPVPDQERLVTAVEELNENILSLSKRLVTTEEKSNDTAEWRKRAEKAERSSRRWRRIVSVGLAAAIAVVGVVNHRDAQRQRVSDLHGCQQRNDAARTVRDLFSGIFDSIDHLSPDAHGFTDPLRDLLTESAHKDRDCDSDGKLTTADYAPAALPPSDTPPSTTTVPIRATVFQP